MESGRNEFPVTSWSIIRHCNDPESPQYQRHLERLVQRYWKPVYCVIRKGWRRDDDDAQDLTQEFFATVVLEGELSRTFAPDRGSFRALLRTAITNFMRNSARDARRKKRGGDVLILSLDDDYQEHVADRSSLTPEEIFDTAWSQTVMRQAMAMFEAELIADGKSLALDLFRRYDLDEIEARPSYGELARELGLSVSQVMHTLRHARAVFRRSVTQLVSEYVAGPEQIATEIRRLLQT